MKARTFQIELTSKLYEIYVEVLGSMHFLRIGHFKKYKRLRGLKENAACKLRRIIIVFNKQKVSAGGVVIYKKITTYNNCRDTMVPCS